MSSDTRFITNEDGQSLADRFVKLIGEDTEAFDCLVGYFYSSGFNLLSKALEKTDKIRILIGLNTDEETFSLMQKAKAQSELKLSQAETKEAYALTVTNELNEVEESRENDKGINQFIDWLQNKKLEIRAFPSADLHAKLYIISHRKGSKDIGRVVTGSSNFSRSGLQGNLELNVELKDSPDYKFALEKFNELWGKSVDVSEKYVQTVKEKTWFNDSITPYQLYLKCLYEYFQEEINLAPDDDSYIPDNYMRLDYQDQAVSSARQIIKKFGGVFLSDVVGLGKTYISALLAQKLRNDGRILVIAPPHVLDKTNPGSWPNVFYSFDVNAKYESIGQLDRLIKQGTDNFKTVFIDEAHRFRSDDTETYANLQKICFGKQVVLVTATPYNNRPSDILSLIKLFQKPNDSTIPNQRNLQSFFATLEARAKKYDRRTDYSNYIKTVKENARLVRENVLKYLMVRRTRKEVEIYFDKDIQLQGLKFPSVEKPKPLFYKLNASEEAIFTQTIKLIKSLSYARYVPMLYLLEGIKPQEQTGQRNMMGFVKTLIVKRMESSIVAFTTTLNRIAKSNASFLKAFEKGDIYISKKHSNKIFEALELDDDDAIEKLIDGGKAERFDASAFDPKLKEDVLNDISKIEEIINLWKSIDRDPKLLELIAEIKENDVIKSNRIIIFTEAETTANYLKIEIEKHTGRKAMAFSGHSTANDRTKVIDNFDANSKNQCDDFDVLITTEVLAEGVNLHRSNVIINYDIPWNPTRMMQRVGRINRVGTKFDRIYTFNFFPTKELNDEIALQEAAEAKIESFIEMLGADAKLLTESEIAEPKGLFDMINSKAMVEDEDGSIDTELKYLKVIQKVRDEDTKLFEEIKNLPRKARSAKSNNQTADNGLLTYFRKGYLTKFIYSSDKESSEIDFVKAASMLECPIEESRAILSSKDNDAFYDYYDNNRLGFANAIDPLDETPVVNRGSRGVIVQLGEFVKILRKNAKMTEHDIDFLDAVMNAVQSGILPKKDTKKIIEKLENVESDMLKMLNIIREGVDLTFLQPPSVAPRIREQTKREVVLSLYTKGK